MCGARSFMAPTLACRRHEGRKSRLGGWRARPAVLHSTSSPHWRDQRDEYRSRRDLENVAPPVEPASLVNPEGGGDPVTNDGANHAENDGQPERNVLTTRYQELGDHTDDQSGDDRPEKLGHPALLGRH